MNIRYDFVVQALLMYVTNNNQKLVQNCIEIQGSLYVYIMHNYRCLRNNWRCKLDCFQIYFNTIIIINNVVYKYIR